MRQAKVENDLQFDEKLSNPKHFSGVKKVQYHIVPGPVIAELSNAMLEGAFKYGSHNYRVAGVRASTYYDACKRHLDAWWEGQDTDPDSGLPHLAKAIASLVVLRDSQMLGNDTDDRPPRYPDNWQVPINKAIEELSKKYPNPKEPFLENSKMV